MYRYLIIFLLLSIYFSSCRSSTKERLVYQDVLKPDLTTSPVAHDPDDPAVWIDPENAEQSLILGTDKGSGQADGALYVFNTNGEILEDKTIKGLQRPNNVDVEYHVKLNDTTVDIALVTERNANALRIFSLPDMKPLDNGGIPVFENEENRAPMGIAAYHSEATGKTYAILSRKAGPEEGYLFQYELIPGNNGAFTAQQVRAFGKFSGTKEIEAIAVDDSLGHVYYSDEGAGVRKYYADPQAGNDELALFAVEGFTDDREGISIYPTGKETGFIFVSDQSMNRFHVYKRDGKHEKMAILKVTAEQSDGSELTTAALANEFPKGAFIAMSNEGNFHLYDWRKLREEINKMKGTDRFEERGNPTL